MIEQIEEKQKEALKNLLSIFGSQKAIADRLGVRPSVVGNWYARGRISSKKAAELADMDDVNITREQFRPDVKTWYM